MSWPGRIEQYKLFGPTAGGPGAAPDRLARGGPRERWLRQLLTLAFAALLAFAGTVWGLVQVESLSEQQDASREAAAVVERQLEALKRGDLEGAYRQFSERYRHEVPFELFHDLVVAHWAMFRTRQVKFDPGEQFPNGILLRTHILASDGHNYEADFLLRRVRGRWWIDDVHWTAPSERPGFMRVRMRVVRGQSGGELAAPGDGTKPLRIFAPEISYQLPAIKNR